MPSHMHLDFQSLCSDPVFTHHCITSDHLHGPFQVNLCLDFSFCHQNSPFQAFHNQMIIGYSFSAPPHTIFLTKSFEQQVQVTQ